MKANDYPSALPLGSRSDIAASAGSLPGTSGSMAQDVSADAAQFAGYLENAARQPGAAPASLPPGANLPSMPTMPSLAHIDMDTPAATAGASAGILDSLPAGTGAAHTPAPGEGRELPRPAQSTHGALPGSLGGQTQAAAARLPGARAADTAIDPGVEPANMAGAVAEAPAGPGPVLTPAQFQARALKRKAIGLDGGVHAHKQAQAAAHSASAARDKQAVVDAAALAAGVAPPQPVQWKQAAASAPSAVGSVSAAAQRASDVRAHPAALAPVTPAAQASMRQATEPVAVVAAATTSSAAPSATDVRLSTPGQALEGGQTDAVEDAALDPRSVDHTDIPGAPPAPVRLQREQKVIEAVVAEIQAQQVHLAVVNTPESLPLEVLKAL
jgi:hypothetical protein